MKDLKLEVIYLPVEALTPYKNNAKLHPQEQIDEIKASITEFGMNDPIAVCGKENIIVEGHGRLIACQQLGIETVPVIRLDHLTDEQRRAYTLTHNKLTMNTDFDLEVLQRELENISLDMADFGFGDIDESMPEIEEDDFEMDDEDARPEAKSKIGEVYKLGEHYLMCGDSTKGEDVERLMLMGGGLGVKADMVLTDPPYNVNYSNSKGMTIENDDMPEAQFAQFIDKAFQNLSNALKSGGAFYIWYSDSAAIAFRTACKNNGLMIKQCLIWVKNKFTLGRQDYQWRHEPCLYGWKEGEGHYFIYDRTQGTVKEDAEINFDELTKEEAVKMLKKAYARVSTVQRENAPITADLHPMMKPLGLMARLINNSSKKGEIVLDLFGGSGSTLMACEQLGRKCYMLEHDPHYVDVIIERWEKMTGKKAEKL